MASSRKTWRASRSSWSRQRAVGVSPTLPIARSSSGSRSCERTSAIGLRGLEKLVQGGLRFDGEHRERSFGVEIERLRNLVMDTSKGLLVVELDRRRREEAVDNRLPEVVEFVRLLQVVAETKLRPKGHADVGGTFHSDRYFKLG